MSEELIEIRSVIKYLWHKRYTNKQIYEEIILVYGQSKITLRGIEKRVQSLNDGRHTF